MRNVWPNITIFLSSITFLSSCMVGPDFHSPAAPKTQSYTESPTPQKTVSTTGLGKAGNAQYFIAGRDIPGDWWTLFHSPQLNHLIQLGLTNSPNLQAAQYALVAAHENVNAQIGSALFPNVNAQFSGERQLQNNSSGLPSSLFNLYNAGVNISYVPDVFGGARRTIEALQAQADFQQYQVAATYLTLTSNIVTTAITVASLREQISATNKIIADLTNQLKIVRQQYNVGSTSYANVMTQETQLEQTRATLPPLQQNLAQANHSLAVLIGELPSESHLPTFDLNKLTLPSTIPTSLPSLLAHKRPDILAAEAQLHAASAQVGVATANLYPQITLTGAYSWTSNTTANLINSANNVWNFGGSLLQPVFYGGSLHAKKRAAVATYNQTAAQYKQTVLQAFQNVADSLRALQHDAQTLQDQRRAELAALKALRITEQQYRDGGISYVSLLNAEQQYQQATIARIRAEAARYTDTAALFQALGGGWWNQNLT